MACNYQFRSIPLQSNLTARATMFLRYTTSNTFGTMLNSGSWMEPLGCDDMPQTCFDFPGIPTFDRPGGLRGCTSRLMLICDADPGGGLFANVMVQNGTMEFQNCSSQVNGTETKFLTLARPCQRYWKFAKLPGADFNKMHVLSPLKFSNFLHIAVWNLILHDTSFTDLPWVRHFWVWFLSI